MNTEEYGMALPPESSNSGHDWMSLLRTLDLDQILEVLSNGFCPNCLVLLENRIHTLIGNKNAREVSFSSDNKNRSARFQPVEGKLRSVDTPSQSVDAAMPRGEHTANSLSAPINNRRNSFEHSSSQKLFDDEISGDSSSIHAGLSEDPNEYNRVLQVRRKKDFIHIERINGRPTNLLRGLELHTQVFNADEQNKIVGFVYGLQRMGQKGQLKERTYSEPRKWMRGKGRVTIQFGCCYNYAMDRNGNPPGIVRDEDVDPLPSLFKQMIRRMVSWHILPPTCIPDSCIVNIYDEGDCIPPHIDHHDFIRPFCTVSLLTECDILFGSNLKVKGPGEFSGPVSIPLPIGSVLILNGNAADIAKHCIPSVAAKRISITFRKMDDSKLPYNFVHDPELQGIKSFVDSPIAKSQIQQDQQEKPYSNIPVEAQVQQNLRQGDELNRGESKNAKKRNSNSFHLEKDDFRSLGSLNSGNRRMVNRR